MIVYYSPTILTDAGFSADVALDVSRTTSSGSA
jgi:hypothetical protein